MNMGESCCPEFFNIFAERTCEMKMINTLEVTKRTFVVLCVSLLALWPVIAMAKDMNQELLQAIGRQDWQQVLTLLTKGADPNARNNDGRTALMLAASIGGRMEVVKRLIEKGADVNAKDKSGWT